MIASRRAILLAALAAAGGGRGAVAAPGDEMIVVAGQSNALGYRLTAADLPPGAYAVDERVRIWANGRWETLVPGRNTGSPNNPQCWGPEVGFARRWLSERPTGVLHVVKHARGSTALAANPELDWAPASGELFTITRELVRAARRHVPDAPVAAILWMQGEQDAADPVKAAAYRENLAQALPAMRRAWGDPGTPVLLGRIGVNWRQAQAVRDAQAAVDAADPLAVSVDTSSYPLLPDGLHYAAQGQLRLGADLYAALRP